MVGGKLRHPLLECLLQIATAVTAEYNVTRIPFAAQ
jgi:hypothetical protein